MTFPKLIAFETLKLTLAATTHSFNSNVVFPDFLEMIIKVVAAPIIQWEKESTITDKQLLQTKSRQIFFIMRQIHDQPSLCIRLGLSHASSNLLSITFMSSSISSNNCYRLISITSAYSCYPASSTSSITSNCSFRLLSSPFFSSSLLWLYLSVNSGFAKSSSLNSSHTKDQGKLSQTNFTSKIISMK